MLSTWTVIGIWAAGLALVGLAMGSVMAIEGVKVLRSVVRKSKRADRRIFAPLWGAFRTAREVGSGYTLRARDWRSVRAIFISFGGAVALVALGAAPLVMLLPLWYAGTVVYHAGAQLRRVWVRSLRADRRALVGLALGMLAVLLTAGALVAGSGAMLASVPLLALPYRRNGRDDRPLWAREGYTSDLARRLSVGYDLDGGGYAFEDVEIAEVGNVLCWDAPDLDYFPLCDKPVDAWNVVLYVAPYAYATAWPEEIDESDECTLRLVARGVMYDTEHDCHCHGVLREGGFPGNLPLTLRQVWSKRDDLRAAANLNDFPPHTWNNLAWEFTGNVCKDSPFPLCDRCEGTGYVESPGGTWAIYERCYTDD